MNIRININSGPVLFNAVQAPFISLPIMNFKFQVAFEKVLMWL